MLISCPNCKTTFAIQAKMIGPQGRKVKCSKCGETWLQEPVKVEDISNLLTNDFQESRTLPVRYKAAKFKVSYVMLLFVLLLGAATLEVLKDPVKYPMLAQKINLPDYNGIRFHDFHVDSEIVDNKRDFHLKGTIVNITDKKVKIPVINVKVYSQGGRIMQQERISVPKEFLNPFEEVEITPDITKISGSADKVELSFENWMESSLR